MTTTTSHWTLMALLATAFCSAVDGAGTYYEVTYPASSGAAHEHSNIGVNRAGLRSPPAEAGGIAPLFFSGPSSDFHGYVCHEMTVDGCRARVAEPRIPLPGRRWVWRTMFWDVFPGADIALLGRGFYVATIDVGKTFGCPDGMRHFDAFYSELTGKYGFARRVALEGLSRGGFDAYRWAYFNAGKVACLYGDAPVCDLKSWPGGKGSGSGSPADWQRAIEAYHLSSEREMIDFKGNPIDLLAPIAAAGIPIIHVCGDADREVPPAENTDIVRDRYLKMGGRFALIVKRGCAHHPHGLSDPTPIVDFIVAYAADGAAAEAAKKVAPAPGSVLQLARAQWEGSPAR